MLIPFEKYFGKSQFLEILRKHANTTLKDDPIGKPNLCLFSESIIENEIILVCYKSVKPYNFVYW